VLYSRFIIFPLLTFGLQTSFKTFDRGFIELLGPYGISNSFLTISRKLQIIQTGQLTHYTFLIFFGLLLFLSKGLINISYFFYGVLFFFA